ncbi:MAG: FHA domain-containing protein [Candidatus Coatesbacteria bacterium]|nr:FHA domain-containing protein [Candidatus Coatesbacteria bacterium]
MPSLVFTDSSGQAVNQSLDAFPFKIGRVSDNNIVLLSAIVSRYHAQIVKVQGKYYIEDLESVNGVFLNGIRVAKVALKYGDQIKIGNTVFTFMETEIADGFSTTTDGDEATNQEIKEFDLHIRRLEDIFFQVSPSLSSPKINIEASQLFRKLNRNFKKLIKEAEIRHTLYDVSRLIASVYDMQVLLNLVMDLALKAIKAERGFVLMKNEKGDLEVKVARLMEDDIKEFEGVGISQSIAGKVVEKGEPILTFDAATDPRFSNQESIISHNIKSVLCVPLKGRDGETFGVIYADNKGGLENKKVFRQEDLEFFVAFANQSAIAIENASLYEKVRKEEQMRLTLARYLSPQIVEQVLHAPGEMQLGGVKKHVTVLFADIRNFTPTTEQVDSNLLVTLLNEYFTIMTQTVFEFEGTLDKYLGDGLMAVFGAPFSHPDDELRAINSAIKMQSLVENLKKGWKSRGFSDLFSSDFYIGIGISTGEVISGNIGSYSRMDYTVIGDTVNLSSRLSHIACKGQILISEDTYKFVKNRIEVNELPMQKIKGKEHQIKIYEVVCTTIRK